MSDYKNVAMVNNPLVYWPSFTGGQLIIQVSSNVQCDLIGWRAIIAPAIQPVVEGPGFNKLQAPSLTAATG